MTVNVTKPAINVRSKLAELDKPTGIAGEAMLRAETVQEQQALIGVGGRRNAIINGGFDVWQRGTSVSLATGTLYSADRWTGYSSTTGRTYSQDTTEALSIGFKNCGKFVTSSSGSSFYQRVEDVRTFAGQTVTLSFWMKSNIEHTPVWGSLQQFFGSGGSNGVIVDFPDLGRVTTEWKYFTVTVTLPSVEGKTIGSNDYLLVYPLVMSGSTTYWVTGVQLELGKVATPFEHRSYGEELALCQRYYQVGTFIGNGGTDLGDINPTVSWVPQTAMRATASMGVRDDNAVVNRYTDAQAGSVSWTYGGLSHRADNTGFTGSYANGIDQGLFVFDLGSTSSGVGSWIRFHWYADAEL